MIERSDQFINVCHVYINGLVIYNKFKLDMDIFNLRIQVSFYFYFSKLTILLLTCHSFSANLSSLA